MRLHPAFEDHHRRQRVDTSFTPALAGRHFSQAIARLEAGQPLVEHLDVDVQFEREVRGEFPRGNRGRTFAAVHVDWKSDDESADTAVAEHSGNRLDVFLKRPPLDNTQRIGAHRGRISNRNPDTPAPKIKRSYWHPVSLVESADSRF